MLKPIFTFCLYCFLSTYCLATNNESPIAFISQSHVTILKHVEELTRKVEQGDLKARDEILQAFQIIHDKGLILSEEIRINFFQKLNMERWPFNEALDVDNPILGSLYVHTAIENNNKYIPLKMALKIQNRAEDGEPRAQYELGLMYTYEINKEQDQAKGMYYVNLAAEQGWADAQFTLGAALATHNPLQGIKWYQNAAQKEHAMAQLLLSTSLWHTAEDLALYWVEKAVQKDLLEGVYTLGVYYQRKDNKEEQVRGLKLIKCAAKRGNKSAQEKLSILYFSGERISRNLDKGMHWLLKCIHSGVLSAKEAFFGALKKTSNPIKKIEFYEQSLLKILEASQRITLKKSILSKNRPIVDFDQHHEVILHFNRKLATLVKAFFNPSLCINSWTFKDKVYLTSFRNKVPYYNEFTIDHHSYISLGKEATCMTNALIELIEERDTDFIAARQAVATLYHPLYEKLQKGLTHLSILQQNIRNNSPIEREEFVSLNSSIMKLYSSVSFFEEFKTIPLKLRILLHQGVSHRNYLFEEAYPLLASSPDLNEVVDTEHDQEIEATFNTLGLTRDKLLSPEELSRLAIDAEEGNNEAQDIFLEYIKERFHKGLLGSFPRENRIVIKMSLQKWQRFREIYNPLYTTLCVHQLSLKEGKDFDRDLLSRITRQLEEAVQKGDLYALTNLSLMHLKGFGMHKSIEKAMAYALEASSQNFIPAYSLLADCYKEQEGDTQNLAEVWYQKAIEHDDASACVTLTKYYIHINSIVKIEENALPLAYKSAKLGSPNGYLLLGKMYENAGDLKSALKWYKRAAKEEVVNAFHLLVDCYATLKNSDQCLKWILRGLNFDRSAFSEKFAKVFPITGSHTQEDESYYEDIKKLEDNLKASYGQHLLELNLNDPNGYANTSFKETGTGVEILYTYFKKIVDLEERLLRLISHLTQPGLLVNCRKLRENSVFAQSRGIKHYYEKYTVDNGVYYSFGKEVVKQTKELLQLINKSGEIWKQGFEAIEMLKDVYSKCLIKVLTKLDMNEGEESTNEIQLSEGLKGMASYYQEQINTLEEVQRIPFQIRQIIHQGIAHRNWLFEEEYFSAQH